MCSALCFLDTNAVLREVWLGLDNGGGGEAAVQEFRMTYPILYFQPTSTEGSEETDNKNSSPKDSYCKKIKTMQRKGTGTLRQMETGSKK